MLQRRFLRVCPPSRILLRATFSWESDSSVARISAASQFFLPLDSHCLIRRAIYTMPTRRYHLNNDEFNGGSITRLRKISGSTGGYYHVDTPQNILVIAPSITATRDTHSYSTALNYDYTITPTTVLNLNIGTVTQ